MLGICISVNKHNLLLACKNANYIMLDALIC